MLFQNRQKAITNADIVKHNNNDVSFYSISQAIFNNMRLVSSTPHFSDQVMIEIERNANNMIIGTDREQKVYRKVSEMQLAHHDGNGLLHWIVTDDRNNKFTAVKLIAPDGMVQIKLISADNTTQIIHNVCELPQH